MKNFPHQFNDLDKLFNALSSIKQLIDEEIALKDENFGEILTRNGIYTYREKHLTVDEFLALEEEKPKSNRGYLTVARDIRRLFQLLGFLTVYENKSGVLSPQAIQLLSSQSVGIKRELWKNSFLQLGLEGNDGEISHPYRILLKLVQDKSGIETKKLMLSLEAENDSPEEYDRIIHLSELTFQEILAVTGTSEAMAKNAVKILPGIAEQLGDITRKGNNSYPIGKVIITEDEVLTIIPEETINEDGIPYSQYRSVTSDTIAVDPIFNIISTVSIDYTESIRIRQQRLAEHQEIVRRLGVFCEQKGFELYEGKFDCLSTLDETALVFEIKTILNSISDQEKQTIKGVGQLKYYKFSIVNRQMGYENINEFIVYSQRPLSSLIEFCTMENIRVIWLEEAIFKTYNATTFEDENFDPLNFI
ncbi:hypothetical protein [Sphingobacterium sp. 1.A.4]|uniref:hypothetical protein n=1 Tax=Sphingobacterium sp. 1.A.4 TaxID=2044603 RepID=UPI000C0BD783|nr:hypothetical protein [Sphingobacterium sp. 1.A.4]